MGAWGNGTFDNDDSLEFFYVTLDIVSRRCLKTLRGKNRRAYDEQRAAAQVLDMVIAMRTLGPEKLAALLPSSPTIHDGDAVAARAAIKRLEDILKDDDWLDEWEEPRAVRDRVMKEKTALEKRVSKK
jgi:hypothetical protein